MAADQRLPLDLSGKNCRAMKKFTFHGRHYNVGDRFNWRQLSCSIRKAKLLFNGRFITSGEQKPEVVKTEPAKTAAKEPVKTETKPVEPETPKE